MDARFQATGNTQATAAIPRSIGDDAEECHHGPPPSLRSSACRLICLGSWPQSLGMTTTLSTIAVVGYLSTFYLVFADVCGGVQYLASSGPSDDNLTAFPIFSNNHEPPGLSPWGILPADAVSSGGGGDPWIPRLLHRCWSHLLTSCSTPRV